MFLVIWQSSVACKPSLGIAREDTDAYLFVDFRKWMGVRMTGSRDEHVAMSSPSEKARFANAEVTSCVRKAGSMSQDGPAMSGRFPCRVSSLSHCWALAICGDFKFLLKTGSRLTLKSRPRNPG